MPEFTPREYRELHDWMGFSRLQIFSDLFRVDYNRALTQYADLQSRSDNRYDKRGPEYRWLWQGTGAERVTRVLYDG